MKTYQQWQSYKELELIAVPIVPSPRQLQVLTVCQRLWKQFTEMFAFTTEPIVQEKTDRAGNSLWKVYDPKSDMVVYLDSAQAVQFWLEERHQRSSEKSIQTW
jgi:hypothetical protein